MYTFSYKFNKWHWNTKQLFYSVSQDISSARVFVIKQRSRPNKYQGKSANKLFFPLIAKNETKLIFI